MSDTVNKSRRNLLKGTAGVATAAAFGGRAPYVMSQEKKVLRYLGTAVNQSAEIAAKAKEDLGITIEYIPVTTDEVTKRIITQPIALTWLIPNISALKIWCRQAICWAWTSTASNCLTR